MVGRLTWSDPDPRFGGLSGIELGPDGSQVFAVGDKAILVEGRIARDAKGTISAIETVAIRPLSRANGRAFEGFLSDSEGLDLGADNRLTVSFEGWHRVERYGPDGLLTKRLPRPEVFDTLQNNSSLEGVAVDLRGRVITAPERSGVLDRPFPVYRFDGHTWTVAFNLPRREDYLLVGLDYGPDGRLYALERVLRGLFFATRVRAFEIDDEDRIRSEETVLETVSGTHDNLEGLSVWRDPSGKIRLTMVSDDNFNLFQRTEIVEYRLD